MFIKALIIVLCAGVWLCMPLRAQAGQYAILDDLVNNYSLELPASWKITKKSLSKDLIKASAEKDRNTGIQVRLYETNKPFDEFIKWYIEDYIDQMKNHHQARLDIIKEGYLSKKGMRYYYVCIDFTNSRNERYYVKQYLFSGSGNVCILQFGTPYAEKDENEKYIDHAAKTFQFENAY